MFGGGSVLGYRNRVIEVYEKAWTAESTSSFTE